MIEIDNEYATVAHLHSESGDHYLVVYPGALSDDGLYEQIADDFGDEAEYIDIVNVKQVTFV